MNRRFLFEPKLYGEIRSYVDPSWSIKHAYNVIFNEFLALSEDPNRMEDNITRFLELLTLYMEDEVNKVADQVLDAVEKNKEMDEIWEILEGEWNEMPIFVKSDYTLTLLLKTDFDDYLEDMFQIYDNNAAIEAIDRYNRDLSNILLKAKLDYVIEYW